MRIDILTLFPEMFGGPFGHSIVGRAIGRRLLRAELTNIRAFATDRHRTVDDYPYGGGPGMVMKPDPLFAAVEFLEPGDAPIILMSPRGRLFTQSIAAELAGRERIVLICGHYEGVDERVSDHLATDELSIGDYVLTGGELAAMVVVDAVARLLPGVLGTDESAQDESHSRGFLEYPQYTRPPDFRGWRVPEILLSGNHGAVAKWRHEQALRRTQKLRPDLLSTQQIQQLIAASDEPSA